MTDKDNAAASEKRKRQKLTIEQQIAQTQAQLAKLKASQQKQSRNQRTRELVLIGNAVDKAMRTDAELRGRIAAIVRADVTRAVDKAAIEPWLSRISTPES